MTAVLDDRAVDDLLAHVPVRGAAAPASSPVSSPVLVWADSGHGSRPDAAPVHGPDVRMVDLGVVEEFPLPSVDLADLVGMLTALPVADLSGAALVNGVAA